MRRNRRHLVKLHQNIVQPRVKIAPNNINIEKQPENIEKLYESNEKQHESKCFPLSNKTQTLPEGVTITRSGRISKAPEILQAYMFGSVLK